jgi:hypothetical protein
MNRKPILTFILLLSFALITIEVKAYNSQYQINAPFGSTPVINGLIGASEWSDAFIRTSGNATVYIKQDGKSLYVAFNVIDSTVDVTDGAYIAIDKNNVGGTSLNVDDIYFIVFRNGTEAEADGASPLLFPSGWEAGATSTNDAWEVELNITFSKIAISAGQPKTVGLLISYDDEPNQFYWPPITDLEATTPSNWGNLYSSYNWIPEFPSFLILLLFMIVTLLAATVYRRKRKKEENLSSTTSAY